jgi:hypothetical protein
MVDTVPAESANVPAGGGIWTHSLTGSDVCAGWKCHLMFIPAFHKMCF